MKLRAAARRRANLEYVRQAPRPNRRFQYSHIYEQWIGMSLERIAYSSEATSKEESHYSLEPSPPDSFFPNASIQSRESRDQTPELPTFCL
jgi:hypothetical protein